MALMLCLVEDGMCCPAACQGHLQCQACLHSLGCSLLLSVEGLHSRNQQRVTAKCLCAHLAERAHAVDLIGHHLEALPRLVCGFVGPRLRLQPPHHLQELQSISLMLAWLLSSAQPS